MKTGKMTKDEAKSLLLDYIYEEIDEERKGELERCLEEHPDLNTELDELRETLSILQNISAEAAPERVVQVNPGAERQVKPGTEEEGRLKQGAGIRPLLNLHSRWARAGLAAAAVLIAFLLVGALSDMQIRSDSEGWSLTFGAEPAVIQQGIDESDLNEIIELIRQENLLMASSLIEESQLQQEAQMQQLMISVLEYVELRREEDLTQLASGIAQVDEDSYQRFRLTSEALNGLYDTILLSQQ